MAKSMGLNISWFALLSHAEQEKSFLLTCGGKLNYLKLMLEK